MHDIKAIRDNPQAFDAALAKRKLPPATSALLELDEARRANLTALQEAQSRRNAVSKEVGQAKAAKDEVRAAALMAEVANLKDMLAEGEANERTIDADIKALLEVIPNLPRDDVPVGADETANVEVRRVGTPAKFEFKPKQHFELGEALGLMDFESASKVSGARFVFLKGALARLERALGAFMLDFHTGAASGLFGGYTEINPPLLVKDHAAYGTGNLPKFAEDLFLATNTEAVRKEANNFMIGQIPLLKEMLLRDPNNDPVPEEFRTFMNRSIVTVMEQFGEAEAMKQTRLWLIPTAEVSLTNMVRDQILDEDKLPIRLTACTPCFRSEAGAAGRDTRGMIRQHQFTKVELVSITTPEESSAEHERMTACAEEVLKRLKLPFRTMLLCTGDMGFASQKTYDIEVWLPGQDAYREISSCSVCGDFQARRMNARYRPVPPEAGNKKAGAKDTRFVHTLNGSGLAVGRTLVAVMENYQQSDGSIVIPEALRPYMGNATKVG